MCFNGDSLSEHVSCISSPSSRISEGKGEGSVDTRSNRQLLKITSRRALLLDICEHNIDLECFCALQGLLRSGNIHEVKKLIRCYSDLLVAQLGPRAINDCLELVIASTWHWEIANEKKKERWLRYCHRCELWSCFIFEVV